MDVLLAALGLHLAGGLLAFLLGRWPRAATLAGAGSAVLAALLGLFAALRVLVGGDPISCSAPYDFLRGPFQVELDALGAVFLIPVQVLSALAAVYGANYLLAYRNERSLGGPWLFFNLFVAGMSAVLLAGTAFLFLFAWEIMSLAGYFLVTFEHDRAEVRRAGWVYLVAAHLGVAVLLAAFVLLAGHAGDVAFAAFAASGPPGPVLAGVLFVLTVIGFGTKAGLVPLHVWLPEAHPAAPSHVSALMSGVMIKMGIYGMLRVLGFLGEPAWWWGPTLGVLGLVSALVGIALATQQRDLKRVLAYSSIENVGLIALALGLGLWGRAAHQPALAVLGLTAALLHVWNHALMKSLLFLTAGSVLHGSGTRDMERLGGLLRAMPWTGALLILGAVAIAALPPLNGFAGKWLLSVGLLECGLGNPADRGLTALLAVASLALVGTLAALAYVRLCGVALLGSPRSPAAEHAHESGPWMLGPMLVLLLLCVAAGLAPGTVSRLQEPGLAQVLGGTDWQSVLVRSDGLQIPPTEQLDRVGLVNAWLLGGLVLGGAGLWLVFRRHAQQGGPTWGCGYLEPTARIQYSGRSFSEMLAGQILPRFLRPRKQARPPEGLFPAPGQFHAASPDPISEEVYEPLFAGAARRFAALRILQQGKTHVYLLYIFVVLVLGLAWVSLRGWWGGPG
jgi:formate hydrogenlyase subunit 3/multisubunit Na+/H+ antiporter MnhD subunit